MPLNERRQRFVDRAKVEDRLLVNRAHMRPRGFLSDPTGMAGVGAQRSFGPGWVIAHARDDIVRPRVCAVLFD